GANAGGSGLLNWTSFENLSDSTAGNFVFANGASVSGTLAGGGAGTLDYSAYTTAVSVGLGGTATGTSGWSGISTVKGGSASDTISGSSQTYHLTGANAGNNGTMSWVSFENLSDSAAGNFVFANGASVSGMLTAGSAGTLDYSAYTTAVNVGLGGTATGTGGWSGITTAKGGSASDTI
ncbi:hemolysin-type calcium-binding protein, partial [Rhodanobacter spathiphylli B39]